MKKIMTAVAIFAAMTTVSATELSVNYVRDFDLDKDGVALTATSGNVLGFKPELSLSHVNGAYTRYAAGANYEVLGIGPVKVSLGGSGVFQSTQNASNGFAVSFGARASMDLMKNVSLVARVDQYFGQKRIESFDGATATVGLSYKF